MLEKSIITAIILVLIQPIACAPTNGDTDITSDVQNGASLYASDCAACHGADATGGSGPDLVGALNSGLSQESFQNTVIHGDDDMPAFSSYTSSDVADVFDFIAGQ